jgi:protein-S-isoprenylcysteine O-methyltransferase Ste14
MVAGLVPMLLIREHAPYAAWLPFSVPMLGIGICALIWCVRDFYVSGRGTLAPWDPPKRLVIVGLYRFVRNPMYVAVLTILLGWALLYRSWLLLAYALVVAAAFHFRVVWNEEPWLKQQFGADWDRYAARVPRWLPWRSQPRS